MRYALDGTEIRTEPTPTLRRATCPTCGSTVIAKTGRIQAWHWAHANLTDCDTWAEPDTTWHTTWQNKFPAATRELTLGAHRADIVTPTVILEIQHSHLSIDDICERERFYSRIARLTGRTFVWLFDATEAAAGGRLELRRHDGKPDDYRTFRWRHARKSIAACHAPTFLDLPDGLLQLGRLYPKAPTGGFGTLTTASKFLAMCDA